MTERPLMKVGVAGLGVMGRNHARVLSDMRGVRLTCAFDPDGPTAEAARVYGAAGEKADQERK